MKIGGYHFLAVECTYQGTGYTEETVGWLKNTLEAIKSDPDYHGEYIFLMTHAAVTGTVTAQGDGGVHRAEGSAFGIPAGHRAQRAFA